MKASPFSAFKPAGLVAGLVLLTLLPGCANSPGWGAWSMRPTEAQVNAALQQPVQSSPPLQTHVVMQRQ